MAMLSSSKFFFKIHAIIQYFPSDSIPKMLIGDSGSNMRLVILYAWYVFTLSVRTRHIVPTNFVLALIPSAVSSIILVGVRWPVKNLCVLQMIAVVDFSTKNGNTSVS